VIHKLYIAQHQLKYKLYYSLHLCAVGCRRWSRLQPAKSMGQWEWQNWTICVWKWSCELVHHSL